MQAGPSEASSGLFKRRSIAGTRWRSVRPTKLETFELAAFFGLLFTAQPKAPAFVLAGASGWAVNDKINAPLTLLRTKRLRTHPEQRGPT
jgi:hypothetical protein